MRIMRKTPTRLDGVEDVNQPSTIERAAVLARGHEDDNYRLRLVLGQMESQIWNLQRNLNQTEADLQESMNQVDELLSENSALQTELEDARHHEPDRCSDDPSGEPSDGSDGAGEIALGKREKGRSRKVEQAQKAKALVDSVYL